MQPYTHLENVEILVKQDFKVWYNSFRKVIERRVPNFENLLFLSSEDALDTHFQSQEIIGRLERYFKSEHDSKDLFLSVDNTIFFTIAVKGERVVAVITGMDSYFANRVSLDWLSELSTQLTEVFLLIKKGGSDLETGLPNGSHFFSLLREVAHEMSPSLILIELFPKVRSAIGAQIHKSKAVCSLKSCLGNISSLFYLGHHVFALLLPEIDKSNCRAVGRRIFSLLRRDGFRKIHMGMRWGGETRTDRSRDDHKTIFDQVSFALHAARRRGPFSFCDYWLLSHPEKHPLSRPSRALLAKFQRRWKGVEAFTIIELRPSIGEKRSVIEKGVPKKYIVADDDSIYLFFAEKNPEAARRLCEDLLKNLDVGDVQRGIAYYPHLAFGKSTIVFNCRKALCHAAFFGKNASAIFDEVSLNVSGDIYYAEGDLASAVKEYKTGILCDKDNINLLNSLGVAYADMDQNKAARICFERVLALDPLNFMALYNSGLEAELNGRTSVALTFFEKALKHFEKGEDEEIETDLQYRLGRLCSLEGKHRKAVDILLAWYNTSLQNVTKERALPYLGMAYYGLRKYDEAVKWLQKALQYNEFDAESMGLLGMCYLLQKEGDDIALSLCEKSVEFAPDNSVLQIYLARAQIACKLHDNARNTLSKCLRQKSTRAQAQLLSCLNFKEQGKVKRACYWLGKVSGNEMLDEEIADLAKRLHEELDEI